MSSSRCSLLVVDAHGETVRQAGSALGPEFEVLSVATCGLARNLMTERHVDLLLLDGQLADVSDLAFLDWVRSSSPETLAMLIAERTDAEGGLNAISRGQIAYCLLKPWSVEQLVQVVRRAAERVGQQLDLKQLQHRNHELELLALTDPLTGLLNRRAIENVAEVELNRHRRYGGKMALGIVDADDFREINRKHLLPGGDVALFGLAKTLTQCLRTVDSVGRIGGDEFLIVAPETGLEGAGVLGERIRAAVALTPVDYQGARIQMTVSVGFAVVEGGASGSLEEMKRLASVCLQEAKVAGKNQVVVRGGGD